MVDGGECVANFTWRLMSFCTLLEGRPFWIIMVPMARGYGVRPRGAGLVWLRSGVAQVVVVVRHVPRRLEPVELSIFFFRISRPSTSCP